MFVALDKLELWDDEEEELGELEVDHVILVEEELDFHPLEINSRVLVQTREGPERGTIIFCDLLPGNESLGYYVGVDMVRLETLVPYWGLTEWDLYNLLLSAVEWQTGNVNTVRVEITFSSAVNTR